MASVGSSWSFNHVSAHVRPLFGHVGSAHNQDALAAQDLDAVSREEDFEASVAYREAKRAKRVSGDGGSRGSLRSSGTATVKNAANRRTGEMNRCFIRDSE